MPTVSSSVPRIGQDFAAEARLLFRVVACAGAEPLPKDLDAATVKAHCRWLRPRIESYRARFVKPQRAFFARLLPPDLPRTVVYPFGGGDLLSALTTFPEATSITTLSLEHAGDPRRLRTLGRERLAKSLGLFRKTVTGLLCCNNSTSDNLMSLERSDLPGEVSLFLVALAIQGYEPVALRYFQLDADGAPRYLTAEEIAAEEPLAARRLNVKWVSPNFSAAFSNAELTFRAPGKPPRVHRHFAANLANEGLAPEGPTMRYLVAQGRVAAMTKAASYCLWNPRFSRIRDYLLQNMAFMVSDSTGIPPRSARAAGFAQVTYGRFTRSFLPADSRTNADMRALWQSQPRRELSFRYGYLDHTLKPHLMVTRPATLKAARR
jgi:hypothetical protein